MLEIDDVFFNQKAAYEMRIGVGSSDVCSSDLHQDVDGVHWLGGTILYCAGDGTLIGDKTLDFSAEPYIPVYRFDMKTDGYHGAITSVDATHVVMAKRSTGKDKLQRKTINPVQQMTADSGFHA